MRHPLLALFALCAALLPAAPGAGQCMDVSEWERDANIPRGMFDAASPGRSPASMSGRIVEHGAMR